MYNIIEDQSPFYITFSFPDLEKIVNFVKNHLHDSSNQMTKFTGYSHINFSEDLGTKIIEMLPMSSFFNFNKKRVAIFETPPGKGSGIHKDGTKTEVSFNIPIEINDNFCYSNWYSDEMFDGIEPKGLPYVRNVVPWHSYEDWEIIKKYKPIKQMVTKQNEMVLFNTNIFHNWDNSLSKNYRRVLTMRIFNPYNFNEVKNLIFK